jgi:hypothetical protein
LATQRQPLPAKLNERQRLMMPSQGPDRSDLGETFPSSKPFSQDAILRPPKPQIAPFAEILQLTAEHDAEPEAAG